jgi:hypothetical protein
MNEFDDLEQELNVSLAALDVSSPKPCGCHESGVEAENPFAEFSGSDDLTNELELALASLDDGENLSAEEAFEFASVAGSSNIGLEDIVSLTEQYPGLKITFSQ